LMRRNIRLSTKMKILNCYVFSVLDYGCETWTWNSPMRLKVNAFEMWCYRMILGISWRDKVSNKKVMIRVQTELQTELHFTKDMNEIYIYIYIYIYQQECEHQRTLGSHKRSEYLSRFAT